MVNPVRGLRVIIPIYVRFVMVKLASIRRSLFSIKHVSQNREDDQPEYQRCSTVRRDLCLRLYATSCTGQRSSDTGRPCYNFSGTPIHVTMYGFLRRGLAGLSNRNSENS